MKQIKVYIASPYSKGDIGVNVKTQLDMFETLTNLGFFPIPPLWSHFQHLAHPKSYEFWCDYTMELMLMCNCVLRLPGESSGADNEVKKAEEMGIPVFYSVDELLDFYTLKISSCGAKSTGTWCGGCDLHEECSLWKQHNN